MLMYLGFPLYHESCRLRFYDRRDARPVRETASRHRGMALGEASTRQRERLGCCVVFRLLKFQDAHHMWAAAAIPAFMGGSLRIFGSWDFFRSFQERRPRRLR